MPSSQTLQLHLRSQTLTQDDVGQVYVVDAYYGRVQIYAPSGAWIRDIGTIGRGPGLTEVPLHAVVDPLARRLYVSDSTDHEVETYDTTEGQ
jgi:DNA-binding beta-propeller fold protein YncE